MRKLFLGILFYIPSAAFCQADLQKGLKLYYDFSGKARDLSGNNNNPKHDNTKSCTDRNGNPDAAAHFDGKKSYIRIPDSESLHMDNQISLCVWIRPTGFYKGKCHGNSIIMKGKQFGKTYILLRYDDNFYGNGNNCNSKTDPEHQNFYGSGMGLPGYTPYVKAMEWQSVVYTYDGKTARLYIGCDLVKSQETEDLYFTNLKDLFIGTIDENGYPYWMDADLDDLRIYDRALDKSEIEAISGCGEEKKLPSEN